MSRTKPTIEDVARVAGVSRATASRVINDVPGASAPLRTRVHAAVAELGYQPDETARALASGRVRAVDVIAVTYGPGIGWLGTHPYFSRVLAGVMPVLEGARAQLRLHAVPDDVSIIGFDDSIAAVCTNPALTTMRLPVEEMAAAATRLLLQGVPASGHRQQFAVELVTRDSTPRRLMEGALDDPA